MAETREVRCGRKTHLVRRYDDGTVALLDAKGNLVAGWPETWSLMGKSFDGMTDAHWSAAVEGIRPLSTKP